MSGESLWDYAVKENENRNSIQAYSDRTLVFCGSKTVGKTSLIYRFLERNETPRETLALEYTFGRKSGRSLIKDVCNFWELGGGTLYKSLLSSLLGQCNKDTTVIVLMVDLSKPSLLWSTLESLLHTVFNQLKVEDSKLNEHKDCDYLINLSTPLVIIGGKYDIFQDLDPENKKIISRTLRHIAHSLSADLIYYSDKDNVLIKKCKEVLNYYGFGGPMWKGHNTDYSKPLLIARGEDSFEHIGVGTSSLSKSQGLAFLEKLKYTFTSHFNQDPDDESIKIPDDPALDSNFREPIIDALRGQKEEELERLMRESANRRKMGLV